MKVEENCDTTPFIAESRDWGLHKWKGCEGGEWWMVRRGLLKPGQGHQSALSADKADE
jgi:hypothetical protein